MTNTKRLIELAIRGLEADRARIDYEIADLKVQWAEERPQNAVRPDTKTTILIPYAYHRNTAEKPVRRKVSVTPATVPPGKTPALLRVRSAPKTAAPKHTATKKGGITASGRKRLSAIMKARWREKGKNSFRKHYSNARAKNGRSRQAEASL